MPVGSYFFNDLKVTGPCDQLETFASRFINVDGLTIEEHSEERLILEFDTDIDREHNRKTLNSRARVYLS